jgi:pantoate--beta-alanine ligase
MRVVDSMSAMQRRSEAWVRSGEKVGLVPTMGALHEGHLTLIRRAKKECKRVVVSIYVNPTQFGPKEDLAKYPRPREKDLALCRKEGVDVVFAPKGLYHYGHSTYVEETKKSQGREGAIRPGHFRGVATVVLKLFNLVRPTHAYFGQKDAQQVEVIQQMVLDLNVPVKVVVVPTVRDHDGLALSSRNVYLSPEERNLAVEFAALLQHAAKHELDSAIWFTEQLKKVRGITLDYVDYVSGRLVAAVRIGNTRLLDNRRLTVPTFDEGFAVRTVAGNTASHAFIWLKGKENVDGEFQGSCNITGSPAKPRPDARKLLALLRKRYKGRGQCRAIVDGANREFTMEYVGSPPLSVRIKLRKKGDSKGAIFAGKKQIGIAVVHEDEMTPEERRKRERYRLPKITQY